jgi:hypothetical protein
MGLLRRITISVATAVSVVAAGTVASVGAAGGFGQAPGHYAFDDTSASVSFFNPTDLSNMNLSVDRSLFTLRPKGGGGSTTQNMTVLSIFVFTPSPDPTQPPVVSASGCFIIPAADFVVGSDLQHASLNATVNAADSCPGFLIPVLGAGPAKGVGGGGDGFTFPLTVTASWTGTGLVGLQQDQGRFTCGTFATGTHTRTQSALSATVTAAITGFGAFSGGPNAFGDVFVSDVELQVTGSGVLPAGCGGGKG